MQSSVQEQLREYRAKKEAERKKQILAGLLKNPFGGTGGAEQASASIEEPRAPSRWSRLCTRAYLLLPESVRANRLVAMGWPIRLAVFLLLWMYFVYLEWGAVFFICGLMYLLIDSMRPSNNQNRPRGLSAYSVFNPNFQRLDGTFTAEDFDRSVRSGFA